MPFKYWEMRGWFNKFMNPLIVTALYNPFLVTYHARMPALYSHRIGIRISWCSIYNPSSEYRLVSIFGCHFPPICDNVRIFWWNICVSKGFPDNWMAHSFIFGYNGCYTDLFDGKVKKFGGSSTGKFISNHTIMGN